MRKLEHIELTLMDARMLRELVRPFNESLLPDFMKPTNEGFVIRLYRTILALEIEEPTQMQLSREEVLLINQLVGAEDWEGAQDLLRQTWCVLYELDTGISQYLDFAISESSKNLEIPNGRTTA